MSNISTTYAYFSAVNYKGENTNTGYALSGLPLKFIPDSINFSDNSVLWLFGDGTSSSSLSTEKAYQYPGEYTVNLFVYDCYDNALLSVFSKEILIKPYLPTNSQSLTSNVLSSLEIESGKLIKFDIDAFFPAFRPVSSLFFNVSGSNSVDFLSISSDKFSHLQPTYSFYEKIYNFTLSDYQFSEIDKIELDTYPIFGKINSNQVETTTIPSKDTFFIGTSGRKSIYYRDDTPSDMVVINFHHDKSKQRDFISGETVSYHNLMDYSLSASIIPNLSASGLSITSNGYDGEGIKINSFDIDNIKFTDIKIPFIIKVKDNEWYNIKEFPKLELSSFKFSVLSSENIVTENGINLEDGNGNALLTEFKSVPSGYYILSSLNSTLSSIDHDGSFRGYIKFNNDVPIRNVSLSAITLSSSENFLDEFFYYGGTNTFSVYPKNYYTLSKINEDLDMGEIFKDLRFQEFLLDDTVLFDEFIGSIFGNIKSSPHSLGKRLSDKIQNYFSNHKDIDRCEIFSLISELDMMDNSHNIFVNNLFNSPEKLKYILNLASISDNKLFGTSNKFDENFDPRGFSTKEVYGRNLGPQINFLDYTIDSNQNLVALEKFSNKYSKLDTDRTFLDGGSLVSNPPLSAYSEDWGWPLILPSNYTPEHMDRYYAFFESVETEDGTITNHTLDLKNSYTSISSNIEMFKDNEVFDNMIIETLYENLSLFDVV